MDPVWIAALATLASVAGLFSLWLIRLLWRTLSRTIHFLDDYFGQPAHDGVPARPGVMARLGSVEELLAKVVAETTPNGGGSMRDEVARTARDVGDIKDEQSRLRTQIELRAQPGAPKPPPKGTT